MLTDIVPKLPMRDKEATKDYYQNRLGFAVSADYGNYLIVRKDGVEIHFFAFKELDPKENYGQVYVRTDDVDGLCQAFLEKQIPIHPRSGPETKPWGQREFALLDPDHNLLTFGQSV